MTEPTSGGWQRRRSAQCPSTLRLDQWLAGELPPEPAARVDAHVSSCASCQQERATRLDTRRQFAQQAPDFAALARSARSGRRRWLPAALTLAAAAAALLLVTRPTWRAESLAEHPGGTRAKGSGASFGWVVRRGERVFAPAPEEPLRPGDALRFTVSTHEPVFVAILGLDAQGQLNVYHPDAERLSALEPGAEQPLPAAFVLDAAPGDERLYGVFCRSALPVAALRDAVARAPDAPVVPDGCRVVRQILHKEAP